MAEQHLEYEITAKALTRQATQAVVRDFATMDAAAKKTGDTVTREGKSSEVSLGKVSTSAHQTATSFSRIGAAASSSFNTVRVGAGHMLSALNSVGGAVAGMASKFALAGGVISGAFGTALGLIGKRGVEFNLTVSGASVALTQLLGSGTAAAKFLNELRMEAAQSIPTLQDLVPIAVQLVQAYGPGGLGKVIPTLRAFGDAASITGAGTGRMEFAMLQFRQLLQGKVNQEDISGIGENLGINTIKMLQRAFGTADTETLQKAGRTGAELAEALVQGMQRQFGGAQMRMAKFLPGLWSNIQDAGDSISGRVTGGLMGRLTQAADTLLGFLNRLQTSVSGGKLLDGLARGFTAIGDSIVFAVSQFPAFISQFGAFLAGAAQGVASMIKFGAQLLGNQELVRSFAGGLANVGGLLLTIIQTLFRIDFGKVFDPKNIVSWFQMAWEGTKAFISGVFGMTRAFDMFKRVAFSAFEDIYDFVRDLTKSIEFGFRAAFMAISQAIRTVVADAMRAVATLSDIIGPWMRDKMGLASGMDLRKGAAQVGAPDLAGAMGLAGEQTLDFFGRQGRARERFREDPDRAKPFGQRIGGAFSQKDDFERKFFADLERNAQALYNRFRGGVPESMGRQPYVPELLFPGGGGGGGSVSLAPTGPAIPSYPSSGYGVPGGGGFPQIPAGQGMTQIVITVPVSDRRYIEDVVRDAVGRQMGRY